MPVPTVRPKILGIGYPRFAIPEWQALAKSYDIHYFVPTVRKQVVSEVKRLCEEEGPFVAAYVLFGTSGYSPFHEDMLAPLFTIPGYCGLFAQGGAGYDDVAWEWLAEQGCYLSNTPDAVTEATADMAVVLMLNILRGTTEAEMNVRAGRWRDGLGLTKDPAGLKLGIIGLGSIGKSMASKVPQFGMNVIYHNRTQLSAEDEASLGVTYASFDELLATADVISLNCPLTPATRGLIGSKEIAKMKDGVFIVNTARGAVIDEEALINGLKSGKISRAGLDVLANEPCTESWLFSSPKVTLQPHVGAFTEGTILRGERAVFANVKKFLQTGHPETPVNEPAVVRS